MVRHTTLISGACRVLCVRLRNLVCRLSYLGRLRTALVDGFVRRLGCVDLGGVARGVRWKLESARGRVGIKRLCWMALRGS
jgi:hypothetical protein